jgi:hypothetical protein
MMDFATLAAASPTVLYLAGVIYLFHRLEKANQKMEKLVERYHTLLVDGVSFLRDVKEHMEAK